MPALELTRLHGHGVSSGGSAGRDADDDERDTISLPTHAPTDASGMPGDLDDIPVDANLFLKP
eukprot:3112984-Pyramimonas_sp.AAC.1